MPGTFETMSTPSLVATTLSTHSYCQATAHLVGLLDVRAPGQQQLHDGGVAVVGRDPQQRLKILHASKAHITAQLITWTDVF